jgi:very-short-patch-repair endonuclease
MIGDAPSSLPPPERGRTASEARRVGVRQQRQQQPQYNRTLTKTARARNLRRRSTEAEKRLWSRLRSDRLDGLSFRRQHPAGTYFLDFYCPELRLAIELDGGQHTFRSREAYDSKRTAWLHKCGVTEVRFWNNDVAKNINGVLEKIKEAADELRSLGRTPTRRWRADLPLSGGGEK